MKLGSCHVRGMGAGSVVQWTVKNDITASKKLIDSQKTVWEEVATGSTQWQFCTYLNPNEPQQQSERTQHHHLQSAGLSFQSNWQAGEAQRKTDIDLVSVLTQHWDSWSSHPHFIRAKTENSEAILMALNWSFFFFFGKLTVTVSFAEVVVQHSLFDQSHR